MFHITKFSQRLLILLLLFSNILSVSIAKPIEQAVMTFAVTNSQKAYLIQVFENGKIQYRGAYGVKTIGKREAQISPQVVKEMLKKFEVAGSFSVADDRIRLPLSVGGDESIKEAIYLQQAGKTAIFLDECSFYGSGESANPLFSVFRSMILRKTNAAQWVTYPDFIDCSPAPPDIEEIQINKLKFIKN